MEKFNGISDFELRRMAIVRGAKIVPASDWQAVYEINKNNHMAAFCSTSGGSNLPDHIIILSDGDKGRQELIEWLEERGDKNAG